MQLVLQRIRLVLQRIRLVLHTRSHSTRPAAPAKTPHRSYHAEYRTCGNRGCKCYQGERHGPYWYAEWREGGKVKRQYLGKQKPSATDGSAAGRIEFRASE